jgi:hypothetical protein
VIEHDVALAGVDGAEVPELVERLCAAQGLTRTLLGTLKSYPGSMHWHFARPRQRGTLEVTWIAASGRLWLSMQSGRSANWIGPAMAQLKVELERAGS